MKTLPVPERDFQNSVLDLARLAGWRVHHTRPARTERGWRTPIQGDAGFPDLCMARKGRLAFVELKTERGRVTREQQAWLDALAAAGVEVHEWRPSDWPEIERVLR